MSGIENMKVFSHDSLLIGVTLGEEIVNSYGEDVYLEAYELDLISLRHCNKTTLFKGRFNDYLPFSETEILVAAANKELMLIDVTKPESERMTSFGNEGATHFFTIDQEKIYFRCVNNRTASLKVLERINGEIQIRMLVQFDEDFDITVLSPNQILIKHEDVIQYWGIPESKLRAYHERQIAAEDQELPELPEV